MKVKAKEISGQKYSGYYNHKRRVAGEVFDLTPIKKVGKDGKVTVISPEKQFSDRWMEKVDLDAPASKQKVLEPQSDIVQGDEVI